MRLAGLLISNYKCIPASGCKIKIDDIVVLIGQNNSGKSTILDAYEAFASMGDPQEEDSFHHSSATTPISIEGVFTDISEQDLEALGKDWPYEDSEFGRCIKVKWEWKRPGEKGEKYSFNPKTQGYQAGGVGGWDTLIQSRIPKPIRIRPNSSSEEIQTKITGMLKDFVKEKLKGDNTKLSETVAAIDRLTASLFSEVKAQFDEVSNKISTHISKVFPVSKIEFVPRSKNPVDEKSIGAESFIKIFEGTSSVPLINHGTGIQRAFLWSAISVMAERGKEVKPAKKKGKAADSGPESHVVEKQQKILLIDEPEAFLHPPSIRHAREALYDFALLNEDWQVIATTHSPIFIDISKDHTTIIRVSKEASQSRYISTDEIGFGKDQKEQLAMVRACNPLINEFFFYDNIILVEGETEQILLSHVSHLLDSNVHIINCFGKGNIPLFCRILEHFKTPYKIIHDSDSPKCKRKSKYGTNSMWSLNRKISEIVEKSTLATCFAHVPNLEGHYLGEELSSGKVDMAIDILFSTDPEFVQYKATIVTSLKEILEGKGKNRYSTHSELVSKVQEYITEKNLGTDPIWELKE